MRLTFLCLTTLWLAGCAAPKKSCCASASLPEVPVAAGPVLETGEVWQDDGGKDFKLADLRGRPVIISMFYASCEGVCVITKNDLKAVEASLPAAARARTAFVLVTLAPERDTAKMLRAYRAEHGLAAERWMLLRGSPKATAALAARLGIGFGRDESGLFRHASELTVLDETGKIILQQDGIHADLAETVKTLAALGKNEPSPTF